jgi:hypothetical protein
MNRGYTGCIVAVLMAGISGWAPAEELISSAEPVAVSTSAVIIPDQVSVSPAAVDPASVALSTVPVTVPVPVAVSTTPVIGIPVAVPVDAHRNQDTVAWKKLEGTVQSLDRNIRALTLQDREGKNIHVVVNDRVRIYRGGEPVPYSEIDPQDKIVLRVTNQASETAN